MGVFVGMAMFSVWTQTHGLGRWTRQSNNNLITGNNPKGRPRKTWLQFIKKDLAVKGLDASLVQNRNAWRRAIRPKSRSGRDNGVVQPSDTGNNGR